MFKKLIMELEKIILVTGGSGLVGNGIKYAIQNDEKILLSNDDHNGHSELSYLVNSEKTVKVKWIFLSSEDGDLSDYIQTEKIFKLYKPTHVIHLAAMVGGLFYNMTANLDFFRKNMSINDNVLQMSFKYNVQKVISCLSSCIFPHEISSYPIAEHMIHDGKPHNSNFGYSYAKRMIDVMNQAYQEIIDTEIQSDLEHKTRLFTSIVPCNVYGPHDNFDLEKGHVIPNLIHKAYLYKKENKDCFNLMGTGKARRQFIYSTDLGKLLIWAIFNYEEKEPIILSVDENDEISINDVARIVLKSMNLENTQITYSSTNKEDGQIKKTVSNSKLNKYLPDFKFTPIEIGIKNTIEWFENFNK